MTFPMMAAIVNVPKRKKCAWCVHFHRDVFDSPWCDWDDEEEIDLWEEEVNQPLQWGCDGYRFSAENAIEAGWHERKPYRKRPKQLKLKLWGEEKGRGRRKGRRTR